MTKTFARILFVTLLPCAGFLTGSVAPDTVVATVDGRKMTAADVDRGLRGVPRDLRENLQKDLKQFVRQHALVTRLAEQAEQQGLADKAPYKQQLDWNRGQVLMQAAIIEKNNKIVSQGVSKSDGETLLREWLDSVRKTATVSLENEDYFSGSAENAAGVSDDAVVATVNGRKLTAGDIKSVLTGAAARVRTNFQSDRRAFMSQYAMMLRLVEIGDKQGLEGKSPFQEQLEWVRSNILMQARLNDYTDHINIGPEQEKEYYDAHTDKYTQAKVKVIYIPFGTAEAAAASTPDKKILTGEQANARVESIRQQLSGGADFVELVRKYSEDTTSKEEDGDFGTIRRSDKIPEHIKKAIFSLKAGQVSQPVRQPNGYYLFRVEKIGLQTLDEVRQTLNREAKGAKFNEWFQSVRDALNITFENEEYFAADPGK